MSSDGDDCSFCGVLAVCGVDLRGRVALQDMHVSRIATEIGGEVLTLAQLFGSQYTSQHLSSIGSLVSVLRSDFESTFFVPLHEDSKEVTRVSAPYLDYRFLLLVHDPEIYPDGHFIAVYPPVDGLCACSSDGTCDHIWGLYDPLKRSGLAVALTSQELAMILAGASYVVGLNSSS